MTFGNVIVRSGKNTTATTTHQITLPPSYFRGSSVVGIIFVVDSVATGVNEITNTPAGWEKLTSHTVGIAFGNTTRMMHLFMPSAGTDLTGVVTLDITTTQAQESSWISFLAEDAYFFTRMNENTDNVEDMTWNSVQPTQPLFGQERLYLTWQHWNGRLSAGVDISDWDPDFPNNQTKVQQDTAAFGFSGLNVAFSNTNVLTNTQNPTISLDLTTGNSGWLCDGLCLVPIIRLEGVESKSETGSISIESILAADFSSNTSASSSTLAYAIPFPAAAMTTGASSAAGSATPISKATVGLVSNATASIVASAYNKASAALQTGASALSSSHASIPSAVLSASLADSSAAMGASSLPYVSVSSVATASLLASAESRVVASIGATTDALIEISANSVDTALIGIFTEAEASAIAVVFNQASASLQASDAGFLAPSASLPISAVSLLLDDANSSSVASASAYVNISSVATASVSVTSESKAISSISISTADALAGTDVSAVNQSLFSASTSDATASSEVAGSTSVSVELVSAEASMTSPAYSLASMQLLGLEATSAQMLSYVASKPVVDSVSLQAAGASLQSGASRVKQVSFSSATASFGGTGVECLMQPPVFRSTAGDFSSPNIDTGGAITLAGHIQGDLIVMWLTVGDGAVPTLPGWQLRDTYVENSQPSTIDLAVYIYTKYASTSSEVANLSLSFAAPWIANTASYSNARYQLTEFGSSGAGGFPYDPPQPSFFSNMSAYQIPWAAMTTGQWSGDGPSGYTTLQARQAVGNGGEEVGHWMKQKLVSGPEDPGTFNAVFDSSYIVATTVITSCYVPEPAEGKCPKHMKGCCPEAMCLLGSDDFNKPDENPVTGEWVLKSGEWEIFNNRLRHVTEGNLITSIRQPLGPDSNNHPIRMVFDLIGDGPWKVICRYASEADYDHIEYTKVGGSVYPTFYRNGTNVMDQTSHPLGAGFTWDGAFANGDGGVPSVSICYSTYEWTTQPSTGSGADWTYCEGDPPTTLPADCGIVGFRLGEFDNFFYYRHWESYNICDFCSCFCSDGVDQKCIPEALTLTLTPTTFHTDCTSSPPTLTFTLNQTQPPNPPNAPFDLSPRKFEWFSDPFDDGQGGKFWWRLVCDGEGQMELIFLDHPDFVATVADALAQFTVRDGARGGSVNTSSDCLPTIRWDFGDFRKYTLQIGSGGPFWCDPFAAEIYSVKVEE